MNADDGLQASERTLESELAIEEAHKRAKDVLLAEAVNILSDEADLSRQGVVGSQLTVLTDSNSATRQ